MERKIGETFEYEGKTFIVKKDNNYSCHGCVFNNRCALSVKGIAGECEHTYREDNKDAVFVEVREQPLKKTEAIKERKIGEVFEFEGKKLKVVKAEIRCGNCFFYKNSGCTRINRTTGECKSSKRSDNESVVFVEITEEQAEQPQELNLCEVLKYCPQGETFWSPMLGDVKFHDINQKRNFINIILENGETWDINADGTISFGTTTSPEIMLYPSREQRDWAKVKYELKKERFDPKTLKPFDRVLCKNGIDLWKAELFSHYDCRREYYPSRCVGNGYLYCIPYNDETKHLVGTKEEAPEFYRYWED